MSKYLIIVNGFFGDIAFSTSIARKLLEEKRCDLVDYLIGFPQMEELLKNDPNINDVFVSDPPSQIPHIKLLLKNYDRIITIGQMTFDIPPPTQMQMTAGINNPDTEFYLYTNPEYDKIAESTINEIRNEYKKPIACVMANWEERSCYYTEEQYKIGIDVPGLGYGGKKRNIKRIISELSNKIHLIEVGFIGNTYQSSTVNIPNNDQKSILFECSLMKYADLFIGAEGGLCNLAAGVGTKTIITTDLIHQFYGWNGMFRKNKELKLGPVHYFKNKGHIELNPYITDADIVTEIFKHVC